MASLLLQFFDAEPDHDALQLEGPGQFLLQGGRLGFSQHGTNIDTRQRAATGLQGPAETLVTDRLQAFHQGLGIGSLAKLSNVITL